MEGDKVGGRREITKAENNVVENGYPTRRMKNTKKVLMKTEKGIFVDGGAYME
jgi:hypothetical protein